MRVRQERTKQSQAMNTDPTNSPENPSFTTHTEMPNIMRTKTRRFSDVLVILMALASFGAARCRAGLALFSNTSDTINIAGNTSLGSAATIEVRIYLTASPIGPTNIYNEYASAQQDKHLGFDGNELDGFFFGVGTTANTLRVPLTLSLNTWHQLAFVYDGSQERMYLDGSLVGSQTVSGSIGNASGISVIGADPRADSTGAGGFDPSFRGYIDTLRVSNNARYSGASYTPVAGDLSSDANTQLLYNFNEAPGSTTIADLSGNGHTGTLGTGFTGSTSPQLVPEPATAGLLGLSGLILAVRRRKRR